MTDFVSWLTVAAIVAWAMVITCISIVVGRAIRYGMGEEGFEPVDRRGHVPPRPMPAAPAKGAGDAAKERQAALPPEAS